MSIAQPTLEDVWQLFRETDRLLKEQAAETNRRFQETERLLKEQSVETDRKIKETTVQIQQTDKKIRELETLFTSQWGKLVESLVEGALVRIFNEWNVPVTQTAMRVHGTFQGQIYEFDIVVHNGEAVIIVEVKTTLRPQHIKHFSNYLPPHSTTSDFGGKNNSSNQLNTLSPRFRTVNTAD